MDGLTNSDPNKLTRRDFLKLFGVSCMGLALSACMPTVLPTPIYSVVNKTPTVASTDSIRDDNNKDFDALILNEMRTQHLAGLAASIVRDKTLVWSRGYGWANIAQEIPMSTDVILNIASTTKTITATALMQLWEHGLFQLDDDINLYSGFPIRNPHFPTAPITFRHLLTHQSSLRDGPAYSSSYICGDPQVMLADWLASYLKPDGKRYSAVENFYTFPPGERFEYSNVGFGVIGYLVEMLSQTSFSDYCQSHVFEPLDMRHTTFYIANLHGLIHATPYQGQDTSSPLQTTTSGDFIPLCLYSFPNIPDGLVRTSVNDLAQFVIACLAPNNGQLDPILQPATLDLMMTSQVDVPVGNATISQGLGWYGLKQNGQVFWGHGGADPGVRSQIYLSRPARLGLIVIANSEGSLDGIVDFLTKAARTF